MEKITNINQQQEIIFNKYQKSNLNAQLHKYINLNIHNFI
jgi:hypothetical protein